MVSRGRVAKSKPAVNVEIVKQIMKEKGLNEKMLAELIAVTPQTVKLFFYANTYSVRILFKIAGALDVSISAILHTDYRKLSD